MQGSEFPVVERKSDGSRGNRAVAFKTVKLKKIIKGGGAHKMAEKFWK